MFLIKPYSTGEPGCRAYDFDRDRIDRGLNFEIFGLYSRVAIDVFVDAKRQSAGECAPDPYYAKVTCCLADETEIQNKDKIKFIFSKSLGIHTAPELRLLDSGRVYIRLDKPASYRIASTGKSLGLVLNMLRHPENKNLLMVEMSTMSVPRPLVERTAKLSNCMPEYIMAGIFSLTILAITILGGCSDENYIDY